ncbi:Uncharacterised protein [Chryseobacterium taklimakanense]|uniref:Uncharacterized protein n=1 Tax=Chryseobacterium taklimakanense TaxID=536441 RepID=A0A239WRD2_9FLAO|nr:Uncharacterised protein [Chryseobacterium taklimakanense]
MQAASVGHANVANPQKLTFSLPFLTYSAHTPKVFAGLKNKGCSIKGMLYPFCR